MALRSYCKREERRMDVLKGCEVRRRRRIDWETGMSEALPAQKVGFF